MTVYVESNFVLEWALQQEQCDSCDAILQLTLSGLVSLVIPAFSLAEPHQALALKAKARNRLSNELRTHLSELGRSRAYQTVSDDFTTLSSILANSADREREGLQGVIVVLLKAAEIIPLDSRVLAEAGELRGELKMSGQDAIVLASVVQHLRCHAPEDSCFLSRNSRDFDDPDVRARLDRLGCRYFADFDQAVSYINNRIAGR